MNAKTSMARITGLTAVALVLAAVAAGHTQSNQVQHASDFTSVEYYGTTNQQQIKFILSGAEALPQPGGLLVIKQLKLRTFDPGGKPEFIVTAPECLYDTMGGTASSAGPLQMQTGDGKLRVEGEGFLWRQSDSSLKISNRVHSVMEGVPALEKKP